MQPFPALLLSFLFASAASGQLQEAFSWTQMDFEYPSEEARQFAIESGAFVAANVQPIGVAAAGSRVFISMPRWRDGVPATLASTTYPANTSSPKLTPYPSWAWNRQGYCEGLSSVYRVKTDECSRLWALDTGVVAGRQLCPPQVVAFDLRDDTVLLRYRFPSAVLREGSMLASLEVEYPGGECGEPRSAVLYTADVNRFALLVVDLAADRAWRVQDKSMYPSPEAGTFTVNGQSFEMMDGVIALALSPRKTHTDRMLYFHAMSSFRQRWVRTDILRNESKATSSPRSFQEGESQMSGQAGCYGADQAGVLFFGLVTQNRLACWNTRKPFVRDNVHVLASDDNTMQFIASVSVDTEERVWAISTRVHSFFKGTLDRSDTNYRVFVLPDSRAAVKGTRCERTRSRVGSTLHTH